MEPLYNLPRLSRSPHFSTGQHFPNHTQRYSSKNKQHFCKVWWQRSSWFLSAGQVFVNGGLRLTIKLGDMNRGIWYWLYQPLLAIIDHNSPFISLSIITNETMATVLNHYDHDNHNNHNMYWFYCIIPDCARVSVHLAELGRKELIWGPRGVSWGFTWLLTWRPAHSSQPTWVYHGISWCVKTMYPGEHQNSW